MRIIRWFDSKRRISNLYEESIRDDLWLTLIFRPDIALFKITHLPGADGPHTREIIWYIDHSYPNWFLHRILLPVTTINGTLQKCICRCWSCFLLPRHIYFKLSLWPIIRAWHSIRSVTWQGICDGVIVVTNVSVTLPMLSQVSGHLGSTFVMCPAEPGDKASKGNF